MIQNLTGVYNAPNFKRKKSRRKRAGFREKNKLSLRQLAKISGINAAVLEKIKNQTLKKIKFSHLEKLCKTLKTSIDKLL